MAAPTLLYNRAFRHMLGTGSRPSPVKESKIMRKLSGQGRAKARPVVMAVVLLSIAVSAGCANFLAGALTAGQAFLITPETEEAIGREAAAEFLRENTALRHESVQEEVRLVGRTISAVSSRPDAAYTFTAVEGETPNAFALPGGPIFVTRPLLVRLTDEAQLAGVLAHEVAHVAHSHGIAQLRQALVLQGIAIATLGDQPDLLRRAAAIALDLVLKGRGRAHEAQADTFGTRWMAAAGYEPAGVVDMLVMFQQMGDVPGYLVWASDHPALADRIRDVEGLIAQEGLGPGKRNAERYQQSMAPLR